MAKVTAMSHTEIKIHNLASQIFGAGLWEKKALIADGKVSNTFDKPLVDPQWEQIKKLAGPAMYYARTTQINGKAVDNMQIIIAYGDGTASYAGVLRDKEGEFLVSDTDEYSIHEVAAKSKYQIPGSDQVIEAGYLTLKAYAQ